MNVYEKLLKVQQNLKAPKNQYNKFGDFHYRSCEDIQEAVKPLLAEVKAVLLVSDEVVLIGSRFYIKATAVLQDTESTDCIANTAFARETEEKPKMDAAQITGSCSSYARKYALNGLFCIDDAKDPDTPILEDKKPARGQARKPAEQKPADRPPEPPKPEVRRINNEELQSLMYEAARTGTELNKVCARYKVRSLNELTAEQYKRAMIAFSKTAAAPPPSPDGQYQLDLSGMEREMPFR